MNKINQLFKDTSGHKIFSIYFCAGCPTLDNTGEVITTLQRNGVDLVEVGMPFSDPLADGPVIQGAAWQSLKNGMSLRLLFSQLKAVKDEVTIPLVLMGYLNPVMQYGFEAFFSACEECGVSGVIIPDLPLKDYVDEVKPVADRHDVRVIMMITPETEDERIHLIDSFTDGFIYMVSSAATTGAQKEFDAERLRYFRRIDSMGLRNPRLIGFGISNRQTLQSARENASGTIIGSRFVELLSRCGSAQQAIDQLYKALES